MNKNEFKKYRSKLNKTQKQMAQLLGVSIKAIHSYEQGWRSIPPAVERQLFFLLSRVNPNLKKNKNCWQINKCKPSIKKACPAWEFKAGKQCWFINGTYCSGTAHKKWEDKMKLCRSCDVFKQVMDI
jgi:DNA-binding XRE family transcriptional regulator